MEASEKSSEWETVKCTADSGVVDIVGPKQVADCIPARQTAASKAGRHYVAEIHQTQETSAGDRQSNMFGIQSATETELR